jgi:hypothetical protein
MSNNFKSDEQAAPIATDEALPLTTPTLEFVPPEKRQQYQRTYDGAFKLEWISSQDAPSVKKYTKEIAAGDLAVHPEGTTRAMLILAAQDSEAGRLKFEDAVMKLQDADTMRRKAAMQAILDKKQKELNAAYARQSDAPNFRRGL